jgi:hypothetical protein
VTFLAKHARKQQRPLVEVSVLAKENGSGLELLGDLINRAQHGQNWNHRRPRAHSAHRLHANADFLKRQEKAPDEQQPKRKRLSA